MTYDTSRIRRMRQRMLARPAVCVERCAILTRSFQATEGESAPIRRARGCRSRRRRYIWSLVSWRFTGLPPAFSWRSAAPSPGERG